MVNSRASRRAVTLVEIVIALTILALLLGVTITQYTEWTARSRETICLDRLTTLKQHIEAWQLQSRRPWFRPLPPPGFPLDPWDRRFGIDPRRGMLWSDGPEGDGSRRIELPYEPYPSRPPPSVSGISVRGAPGGGLLISWSMPPDRTDFVGFEIERAPEVRIPGKAPTPDEPVPPDRVQPGAFAPMAVVSPEAPYQATDPAALPGTTWYYRVRVVPAPGSRGEPPPFSAPVPGRAPETGAPILIVTPRSLHARVGGSVAFLVEGRPSGSPLAMLRIDAQGLAVGPGAFQREIPVAYAAPGMVTTRFELEDVAGRTGVREVEIEVWDGPTP